VTDRNGNVTQYQYDLRIRLIKTTDALGQITTNTYDGNNNVISTTDKDGHATKFLYDVQNRLIKTVDALGNTTSTA
jgi:YD repeat-containing protein